ncbi:hypothetical protein LEP1GSC079_4359 [Leptospira interrogans str. FPW1039]|uniref:Uncharacterized protein n=3 Tax=Leptospira interrogans TaxID=173 RepID=A0A0F6IAE7_LEPIR|nr:hypothetical protein LIL_20080 [Leptospira interrogans serovar Linhai str. 56609]EMJ35022.1 hypothetical protein LEP1GSC079_4359 [Leptospira interrogans str. FPW1039]EMN75033.1 hypothetical protein LEP1GSC102_0100 [Leptospira interrogans str. UI 09600]MCR8627667.1 hypothetical protein [Leptospira interrogans serovar Canicola]
MFCCCRVLGNTLFFGFLKTKLVIGRPTMRFFYFILIFPFLQFCDSEIEFSIPKKIHVTLIDPKSYQLEDRPHERIHTEDSPVWKWITKEIPKLKKGWNSYYVTRPSKGILIDFDHGRRLQILDHGVIYIIPGESALYHDFQNEKFQELLTLIIETQKK